MKNLSKQTIDLISGHIGSKEILKVKDLPFSEYAQSLFLILTYSIRQKGDLNFDKLKDLTTNDISFLNKALEQANLLFEKGFFKMIYNKQAYMETISLLFLLNPNEKKWTLEELLLIEEFALRKIANQKIREKMIHKLVADYKVLDAKTEKTFDSIFDDLIKYILKINYQKFSYKYINQTLFISSLYDKWYCEFNSYNEQIILYHANKRHDVNKYHIQKTFKGHFATIENILGYIDHHDSYVINERYNYDYVSKILNKKRKTKFS